MQGMLNGKVVVSVGAGSGLGRAAVKLWTGQGAQFTAADVNLPVDSGLTAHSKIGE